VGGLFHLSANDRPSTKRSKPQASRSSMKWAAGDCGNLQIEHRKGAVPSDPTSATARGRESIDRYKTLMIERRDQAFQILDKCDPIFARALREHVEELLQAQFSGQSPEQLTHKPS
jgi:hypothetical protein